MSLLNQFSALEAREILKYDFEHEFSVPLLIYTSTTAPKYSFLCIVTSFKMGLGGIHSSGFLMTHERTLSPDCKPELVLYL